MATTGADLHRMILRLQAAQAKLAGDKGSPALERALTTIGMYVRGLVIGNITKQGLVDTGNLRGRIAYRLEQVQDRKELIVGSFDTRYAAVHEFGFQGTVQVKPFSRIQSKAFGKDIEPREVQVRAHGRNFHIKARPYLRPAFTTARPFIVETLRQMVMNVLRVK